MPRLQLFEFEDLPWLPAAVRQGITDFLAHISALVESPYRGFADRLALALERTQDATLIDLCSGGGGPALPIARLVSERCGRQVRVVLTDLYPNCPRLELTTKESAGTADFVRSPVDATRVPENLEGFRLISNAFHHLPPARAQACLADAVLGRRGIAVCEFVRRSPLGVLSVLLGIPTMFVLTPLIRPFRWSRLFLTYVLPVVPLCTLWDGVVSCLRAYRPSELRAMVAALNAPDYEWEIGLLSVPHAPARITYLIGVPPAAGSEPAHAVGGTRAG